VAEILGGFDLKNKLIIRHSDDITPSEALRRVGAVVSKGRISDYGSCYCFVTTFSDDTRVIADRTRTGTDTFIVK